MIAKEGSEDLARVRMDSWTAMGLSGIAYEYFRVSAQKVTWVKTVWTSFIPPKYSFTLWLAMRGKLLTRDKLEYLHIDQGCGLCGGKEETIRHLYFECPFSRALWTELRRWCGLRREMTTLAASAKWIKKESRGTTWISRRRRLVFVCTVYYIWITRNRLYFEGLAPHMDDIVATIKTHVYKVGYALYPSVSILD